MKRKNAFTILELMFVVAIISILAATLFPVFIQTKKRARLTQDIVQMRQVYLAIAMYEEDANDHSPPSLLDTLTYARSQSVYASPVDPYAAGIPGVADFPADISAYGDTSRAPFRISYPYLYPMARQLGFDDTWFSQMRNNPTYGLIAVFMYNDPFNPQPSVSQFDVWRLKTTVDRILTDGSLKVAHGQFGVSDGCSLDICFGPIPG